MWRIPQIIKIKSNRRRKNSNVKFAIKASIPQMSFCVFSDIKKYVIKKANTKINNRLIIPPFLIMHSPLLQHYF